MVKDVGRVGAAGAAGAASERDGAAGAGPQAAAAVDSASRTVSNVFLEAEPKLMMGLPLVSVGQQLLGGPSTGFDHHGDKETRWLAP